MKLSLVSLAASIALLFPQLALGQNQALTDAQCRNMTDAMVTSMKSAPLDKEKDKQSARALIERAEKLIRENKAKGVSECQTWAAISKMVANQ